MLTTKANSAWAVRTSAGITLIDTLFGYAAQDEIVDGMKKPGLDPADIKYVIISHARGDHDGAVLTLGDTTVTIYITPGHTAGTLSFLIPVQDHGVQHIAMEWGGTALGANTSYNDAVARLDRTKARKPGEPNPWVAGKAEVGKYLTVVEECAKSWLAMDEGHPFN